MAFYNPSRKTFQFTPASYTANETTAMFNVAAGDLITHVWTETQVIFNGSGTDAKLELGDGDDPDRYILDGDVDETTTGWYAGTGGSGSDYLLIGEHGYTAADTIDVVFTADTAGTRTTGRANFAIYKAKIF